MPPFRRYENKQDRYEWPAGNQYTAPSEDGPSLTDHTTLWQPHNTPINEYQALMEAPPGGYGVMDEEAREQDWGLFQQKLDRAGLTDRESVVVDSIVFGGRSLFETGIILAQTMGRSKTYSKTTIRRIRDVALAKLRKAFSHDD